MSKKIQRLSLSVTDPASPFSNAIKNEFTEDFINGARKLLGVNFKSGISGDSLIDMHVKGNRIVDDVPIDAFMCNEDYVAPDSRFNTLLPDVGDIATRSIDIKIQDDGTASSYPYNATVLLLLEVDD